MLDIISLISTSLVVFILITLWSLWILYIAMMNIKRVVSYSQIPWQAKILVYPTTVLFEIIEFIANIFVCTLIFWDLPKEFHVSDRLRRYYKNPAKYNPWRIAIVKFIKPMLDPFDPSGPHI